MQGGNDDPKVTEKLRKISEALKDDPINLSRAGLGIQDMLRYIIFGKEGVMGLPAINIEKTKEELGRARPEILHEFLQRHMEPGGILTGLGAEERARFDEIQIFNNDRLQMARRPNPAGAAPVLPPGFGQAPPPPRRGPVQSQRDQESAADRANRERAEREEARRRVDEGLKGLLPEKKDRPKK